MHVVGTAGHVDHGKSTLVERLTGIDPDRFAEEKRRGLTIDLGFAWLTTPSGREVGIVDVPGHERFIKNMLAGAGGISVCLFVVAANEGWMPQSAEHLAILDILGVAHGVVAITKADSVDGDALELVTEDVRERLARTALASAPIVPCSATEGEGLEELVRALDEVLARSPAPEDHGRPRLWVDRAFSVAGAGTVVTGTLAGGSFEVGDEVAVTPGESRARIRSLQTHKTRVEEADPGRRLALNLTGLDRTDVGRGRAIVRPGTWSPTSVIDVELRVLDETITGARHELSEKGAHLLHCGTAETPVRISLLSGPIASGRGGPARLWLRDALPLGRDDRFVLRDAGRVLTFGGGRVLDPRPPVKRPRGDHAALLQKLAGATPHEALVALLEAEGIADRVEVLDRSGARDPGPGVVELGDLLASTKHAEDLADRLVAELGVRHADHPLEPGMQRERARAAIGLGARAFDALVRRDERIAEDGAAIRLDSFAVSLDPIQEQARKRIIQRIEEAGFSPPLRRDLDSDDSFLRALVESGDLVPVGDFYLTAHLAARAKELVREAIARQGPVTVAQIRDLLGTSRKYAVPLCEWLDASGTTRRRGDVRVLPTG